MPSIECNNKLGARPVVRQSKIYRQNESGNAMKSLFGQDHLAWDTSQLQGDFKGQSVFDADALQENGQAPAKELRLHLDEEAEIDYPHAGSRASCDLCGQIVNRYYHCLDCENDPTFDLCAACCTSVYIKQAERPSHPTHDFQRHRMTLVAAPASGAEPANVPTVSPGQARGGRSSTRVHAPPGGASNFTFG